MGEKTQGFLAIEQIEEGVRTYRWLEGIATDYSQMIDLMEREKDSFTICGIVYQARSDERVFNINPHRPIPAEYAYRGLKKALADLKKEIAEWRKKLEKIQYEIN